MRAFEPKMANVITVFLTQLLEASKTKTPVNMMSKRFTYLTFDIVGELAFSHAFHMQTDEKNRFLFDVFNKIIWRNNTVMQMPGLKIPELLVMLTNVGKGLQMEKVIPEALEERLVSGNDGIHDFYAMASLEGNMGPEFWCLRNWSASCSLVRFPSAWFVNKLTSAAGGIILTTTLKALFFYLSRSKCRAKLTEEMRSTFSSIDDIKAGPKLSDCKYLRACIEESLLYPSCNKCPLAPSGSRRQQRKALHG